MLVNGTRLINWLINTINDKYNEMLDSLVNRTNNWEN